MNLTSNFKATAVALAFAAAMTCGWAQTSSNDESWGTYEPTAFSSSWTSNYNGTQLHQGTYQGGGHGQPPSSVMPPDPNSQIPLTGFDWMLMASMAFGMMWLYRQKRLSTQH